MIYDIYTIQYPHLFRYYNIDSSNDVVKCLNNLVHVRSSTRVYLSTLVDNRLNRFIAISERKTFSFCHFLHQILHFKS